MSSRVLWSRLEKTVPSWMRQAKGNAMQGEYAGQGLGEYGDGLAGVAEDVLRLIVRLGFLMELFDTGHLASGLGDLDAVAGEDGPAVHA